MKLVSLENLSKYNELLNQKTVKSVNSVKPDSNGNVTLGTEKSTFNKVEYDTGYFSIGTNKNYSFDLTGSDLENVSKENVNIRLVAKVTTAGDGYNVGDIIQLSSGLNYDDAYGDLDVCSYIRGNTLYVYSGNTGALSNATNAVGHLQKAKVQIKAVLTAFVPSDGSILLIAEDQTNTSKLIGLPDGTLTWKDKNLVRSVNGVNADEDGNVEITTSGADLTGVVKSVNGIQPDESGSLTLEIPSTDGMVKSINSVKPDENGNVDITIPKPTTNIVGVTDNRNLGEIFYSALPLESSQVHLLDGSVLTDSSELYDYLESIKDSNPDLFTTDEEFNSEVESTGKCSKFVINTDNKTVRIPKGDSNNYIVIKNYDTKFEFNQPFSLLEPKWSDVPLNNPSWLLSNGQENSQENYPSVYELLLNEYNNGTLKSETIGDTTIEYKQLDNGHKVVTDKTAYESILKNTGTAWYYLLDLDSRTFVLPQTNGFIQFGNETGKFTEAGLPNIEGNTDNVYNLGNYNGNVNDGAIFVTPYPTGNTGVSSGKGMVGNIINFDASRSNSIYGKSETVQPNSVTGYLYFYVGECVGTSNIVELGNLKDKLDLDVNNIKTELNKLKDNIIKWETDFFDIAPNGLYSFDLSNTPFANIPREEINIQMVGKVKTAQNGFKVDDYVWPQFNNYFNDGGTEIGSTPYISGNVLSIRFGDSKFFVLPAPNGPASGLNKTNVKVKLTLTALIEEV